MKQHARGLDGFWKSGAGVFLGKSTEERRLIFAKRRRARTSTQGIRNLMQRPPERCIMATSEDPQWGRCTVARVGGPYYWEHKNSEDYDFNHRFHVDPNSVRDFERNDVIVHPALSARLKLRGRYWRIEAEEEFNALLAGLHFL
jgi:hypothetical protein